LPRAPVVSGYILGQAAAYGSGLLRDEPCVSWEVAAACESRAVADKSLGSRDKRYDTPLVYIRPARPTAGRITAPEKTYENGL